MKCLRPLIAMAVLVPCLAHCAAAQDVTGTILIKKRLTRPSVTASVSIYQRGTAVALGKGQAEDPLAFERTRVVIYLEGPVPAEAEPAKSEEASMPRIDRRFSPDLLVIPAGTAVSFPNMDPVFHNIFSLSKAK